MGRWNGLRCDTDEPEQSTGTITPKAGIVWLLKNKPAGSAVIVDEAYHHFSNEESCIDLVAADHDIIVTRTFSKIYGMAGIRAGLVFARPEYFQKFRAIAPYAPTLASVSITSAPMRRFWIRSWFRCGARSTRMHGYSVVPGSQTNFFMVDVKRPDGEFQSAMLGKNVAIGRIWAAMPIYVRISVGTRGEMAKFQAAFVECLDQPSTTVNGAASLHVPALNSSELDRDCAAFA